MASSLHSPQWFLLGVALGLLLAAVVALLMDGTLGYLFIALGGGAAVIALGTSLWIGSRERPLHD